MATLKSINPSETDTPTKIQALQKRASGLLGELEDQMSKAFAVAVAGRAYSRADDESDVTAAILFETVADVLTDVTLLSSLKETIDRLANVATEVNHG